MPPLELSQSLDLGLLHLTKANLDFVFIIFFKIQLKTAISLEMFLTT